MSECIGRFIRSQVIGLTALFIALSGIAYAATSLPKNSVKSKQIKDGQVKTKDVQDNGLTGVDIDESTLSLPASGGGGSASDVNCTGCVATTEIADAAVTIPKLAFDPATQAELDSLAADDGNAPNTGANFVHWNVLTGVPAGFADGVDNVGSGAATDLNCASPCVSAGELEDGTSLAEIADDDGTGSGLDADFLDGLSSTAFAPAAHNHDDRYFTETELSSSDSTPPNAGANRVHWDILNGVPGGFADGTDDTGGTASDVNCSGCVGSGDLADTYWKLSGNAGTNPATDFLGTTGSQPLNLRVNNARAFRLEPASDGTNQSPNVIGGIVDNAVTSGAFAATIAGGGRGTAGNPASANEVTDNYGTIGGGSENQAGDAAGTVSDSQSATVAGGNSNTASGLQATVGGGGSNTASGGNATVSGGLLNASSSGLATVAGGQSNNASEFLTTVSGGGFNNATAPGATVGGGTSNLASGDLATVPGGLGNRAAGDFSFVTGNNGLNFDEAHDGVFMYSDSQPFVFVSTAANEFAVRSTGGARFVSAIDDTTGSADRGGHPRARRRVLVVAFRRGLEDRSHACLRARGARQGRRASGVDLELQGPGP